MTLSRIALAASAALVGAPAAAQADPVETVLDAQRQVVRAAAAPACSGASEDEIVVCGRREEEEQARRFRVEPTEPDSGDAENRAAGAQLAAVRLGSERCTPVGRAQSCGGTIPILQAIGLIVRGIQAVRARRD